MKKILSVAALLALTLSANAAPRTMKQKKDAALSVLNHMAQPGARRAAFNGTLNTLDSNDAFTVLGFDGGGFAIIANDDRYEAVVGYSDSKYTSLPDGLQWYLATLKQSIEDGATQYTFMPKKDQAASVAPLMETEWGQDEPYNRMTPKNHPTGCVATAMAQIMYTHRWPEKGNGTAVSISDLSTIDLSKTTYDYANMLSVYAGVIYSTKQARAVATLMYHCGITSDMDYNASGSGTTLFKANEALHNNFSYHENSNVHIRAYHSNDDWMDMVYSELDAKRPIAYAASDANGTGGHAFVFDGYNAQGLVHVNWGWDGECNGYYDMSLLNPSTQMDKYEYSKSQQMITGFAKPDADILRQSEVVTNKDFELKLQNGKLYMGDYAFYNYNYYDFKGLFYVVAVNSQTAVALDGLDFTDNPITGINNEDGYVYGINSLTNGKYIELSRVSQLKDGTYYVFCAVQEDGYENFNMISAPDGVNTTYTLTKKGTNLTLDKGFVTGIASIKAQSKTTDSRIFSIDGRSLGTDLNTLGKGLYIVNGKKIMK